MPEYLSPGVYVEEIDRGPKPIEGVGTAMAVFVGFTEKAQITERVDGEDITRDLRNKPQLITSWTQYAEHFGQFVEGAYLPYAVYGYFLNGGGRCYVLSIRTIPKAEAILAKTNNEQLIVRSKRAGFDALQLRVRVETPAADTPTVTAPKSPKSASKDNPTNASGTEDPPPSSSPPPANDIGKSFDLIIERRSSTGNWLELETLRGVKLVEKGEKAQKTITVVYPNNKPSKWIDLVLPDKGDLTKLWPGAQETQLAIDPKKIPDVVSSNFQGDVVERSGIEGLEALEGVTMVCVPDLMMPMPDQKLDLEMVKAVQTMMIGHCERMGDRVAILDAPRNKRPQDINKWRMDIAGYDSSYAALYYPWIKVQDPILNKAIDIPPCGHIAGIWARNDNTRGVHKAPANEIVQGAVGLDYETSKGEQDVLNPNGVNCIRVFSGRGIRVWGARTLTSDPAWRYINVRRLFNFIEASIERGTQWVVFEPNDSTLWSKVTRDISSFLRTVWLSGALFGNTPEQAFYVKCDEELNPPAIRDLGQLIVEIGLAPVKPAEFVIFRISQWAGPNAET